MRRAPGGAVVVAAVLVLTTVGCGIEEDGVACTPAPSIAPTSGPASFAVAREPYAACFATAYVCGVFMCGGLELSRGPPGAEIQDRCVLWTPGDADIGDVEAFAVRTLEDSCGDHASYAWTVEVFQNPP
jgi:hypothetical protein